MVIAFAITALNFGSSLILTHQSLTETMGRDISLALDIVNDLVSTRIDLFRSNAQTVAERLMKAGQGEMEEVMREQLSHYPDFLTFAVFDGERIIAEYGAMPTSEELLRRSKYIKNAFDGMTVISSTRYNIATGKLVMHVCTPMDTDKVLSITISGMIFSELLNDYILWDTGHIFMLDEEGIVIGHFYRNIVEERTGYIDVVTSATPQATDDFFRNMLTSDRGLGTYIYHGEIYHCAHAKVLSSQTGWRIALSVPLSESPLVKVKTRLLFLAIVFLVASVLVAAICSGQISKPYYRIAEQNRRLEELNLVNSLLKTELEVALDEAQKANQAKTGFLARMSHEMRTPLNAIIGLSELMLNMTPQQALMQEEGNQTPDKLDKIHNSGMTLLGIVNDILDISKIESGKYELHPVEYSAPSLINDIIALNIVRIGEKPVKFILKIDRNIPLRIFGDDLRVKQIFNNLLSNAFKYTNSGTVEWNVTFERDKNNIWLISDVTDTGIGIRQEDIPLLFNDYSQMDSKANRRTEGTGLGLPITKRLAEMMDGMITVKSEYGKGSVFSVRLRQTFVADTPIGEEIACNLMSMRFTATKRERSAQQTRLDLSYARVLIVDDMQVNLDVAKGMLLPYGIKTDCASSGSEAIQKIRAQNPIYDAVFMDHMMPVMDGIEAVRIIRNEIDTDYARNIPIIALTANAITGNEKIFLDHGFQAFVSKPIDMTRLDSVLRQWVRKADSFTIDSVDTKAGIERFGGNVDVYVNVLRSYAVHTRPLMGAIEKHLAGGNLRDYAIVMHGIKGTSFGIGAIKTGVQAERLEHMARAGETDKVNALNGDFMINLERLLDSIDSALSKYDKKNKKPAALAPDPTLLGELIEACREYDAAKADRIMSQLESCDYGNNKDLILWLRRRMDEMNYREISEKTLDYFTFYGDTNGFGKGVNE